jgi:hypothetical protein
MEVGLSTLEVLEVQRASPRSAFQLRLGKDNSKFTGASGGDVVLKERHRRRHN